MTLPFVEVNLSGTFEHGQAYVALSRAVSLAGLRVVNFSDSVVFTHPKVVEFYRRLEASGARCALTPPTLVPNRRSTHGDAGQSSDPVASTPDHPRRKRPRSDENETSETVANGNSVPRAGQARAIPPYKRPRPACPPVAAPRHAGRKEDDAELERAAAAELEGLSAAQIFGEDRGVEQSCEGW